MTKTKFAVAIAVLALGVVVFLVMQQGKLRDENRALRERVEQLSQLKTKNERENTSEASNSQPLSSTQLSELLKLRGEVGVLREQKKEVEKLRAAMAEKANSPAVKPPSSEPVTSEVLPKESWAFVGYATPEATLQSWSWAMLNGKSKMALNGLGPDLLKMWEQQFKDKSDDQLAEEAARDAEKIIGYQILQREVVSDDEVILNLQMSEKNKVSPGKPQRMRFLKINNEWKMAGPASK